MAVAFSNRRAAAGLQKGRSAGNARQGRCQVVRVSCHSKGLGENLQKATVAIAAAALLSASPVNAGVVYETQPVLKKLFQDAKEALPLPKKELRLPGSNKLPTLQASTPGGSERNEATDQVDPRLLALPGAVAFIGAAGFLFNKLDPDFKEFMRVASVKDSNEVGVGYEPAINRGLGLKPTGGRQPPGTKKVTNGEDKIQNQLKLASGVLQLVYYTIVK